ncbi:hypothetical protein MMJ09_22305, partial [Bacillus vallismortis]|nr:hypothetical protein [Bacillus vallismortis]
WLLFIVKKNLVISKKNLDNCIESAYNYLISIGYGRISCRYIEGISNREEVFGARHWSNKGFLIHDIS